MSNLFIPPRVAAQLQEESRRRETEALKALQSDQTYAWKREFDAQLSRIVYGMRLSWCPDPAPVDAVSQGAQPGRWHVTWPSYNGGPLNVQPLVRDASGKPRLGGVGEFVEPGSWVFDELAAADLWDERVQRDRRRIQREMVEAKARRVERERAERDADVLERYLAVSRPQVSMNRSVPWAQNHAGMRAAKAEAARRKKTP